MKTTSKQITQQTPKQLVKRVCNEIFICSVLLYLVLYILEWISPGFVSFYFQADIVLWVVILAGIVHVLLGKTKPKTS